MKTLRNNKGLSLVELIVAIAIFAIAGIAICGFVSFCSTHFTNSNKSVKLQYEQQIVVNRIRDVILEASRGVSYEDNTLKIYSDNPDYDYSRKNDSTYTVKPYVYSELKFEPLKNAKGEATDAGTLYYGWKIWAKEDSTAVTLNPLSEDISKFEVDLSELETKNQITLTITFKIGNREVTVTPVITLRNKISEVTDTEDFSDLYEGEVIEIYSPIQKIEIKRDGKTFAQSKVDTIKLAGNGADSRTTVQYEAVVTKKSTYNSPVDLSVTWKIDESSVAEGYENYISLSQSGNYANVTVKTSDDGTITPTDFTNGGYFIIVATSNEDSTKTARLRVKVETGGVYPKKITTDEASKTSYVTDNENAKIIYTFKHSIEYTGLVEDPETKTMVNPLEGKGVYSKITYSVDPLKGDVPPSGAGFTSTDAVNGEFVVSKSMEEKTYHIVVTVTQKGKDGETVLDEFDLNIKKGSVPDNKVTYTMPVLDAPETINRGEELTVSARWSAGVPVSKDENNNDINYNYWYEWEISWDDNSCGNWGNGERNTFLDIVSWLNNNGSYIVDVDKDENVITALSTSNYFRMGGATIKPYLAWDKTFSLRVTVRAKISTDWNYNNALYYRKPGSDPANKDNIMTKESDEAAYSSQIITINPVELLLEPVDNVVFYKNNEKSQGVLQSVFNSRDAIGKGFEKAATGTATERVSEIRDYYKIFEPTFTGLSMRVDNYKNNASGVKAILSDGTCAVQTYTKEPNGAYEYKTTGVTGYSAGIQTVTQFGSYVYVYLKMTPLEWITNNYLPIGAKWVCVVEDGHGNSVVAKFSTTNSNYINYTIYNKYEGQY